MKVRLKYCFIFDTEEGWARKDDFENDLFSYFMGHDLEAQVVNTEKEADQEDERMVYLEKVEPDVVQTVITKPVNPIFKQSIKLANGRPIRKTGSK